LPFRTTDSRCRVMGRIDGLEKKWRRQRRARRVARAPNDPTGGRALLVYLKPEVTLALKRAALEASQPAYELVEEAIKEFLKRPKK
jgi:hypothetical protein